MAGKFLPYCGVCLLNDWSSIRAQRDNLPVSLTSTSIGLSSIACLNAGSLHLASAPAGLYVIASNEVGKYTLHDDAYVF